MAYIMILLILLPLCLPEAFRYRTEYLWNINAKAGFANDVRIGMIQTEFLFKVKEKRSEIMLKLELYMFV